MIYSSKSGLIYELNEEDLTATIVGSDHFLTFIEISRSVNYQSNEYIITSIGKLSFAYHNEILDINFSEDSELQTIEDEAFSHSLIHSIQIPSSCTKIGKKAFLNCEKLIKVYISQDSKLTIIDNEAFFFSAIDYFFVPPFVTRIGDGCFDSCSNLTKIEIPENSQLRTIGKEAFAWTPINYLYIPEFLDDFGEDWICSTTELKRVDISPHNKNMKFIKEDKLMIAKKSDPNIDLYDNLIYANRNLFFAFIPSFIKIINTSAFSGCGNLELVGFGENSELTIIDKGAFSHSNLCKIVIPSKVVRIEDNAFARCENLQKVDFERNSQLKFIGKHSFSFTPINYFVFPENLIEFAKEWCFYLSFLSSIIVLPKNKNLSYFDSKILIGKSDPNKDVFDSLIFARRDIYDIKIPSFIKYIKSCAFLDCIKLRRVEFTEDSELEIIESYAFHHTAISRFDVPKSVKVIEKDAFGRCLFLNSVNFHEDSELIKVGKFAFNTESLTCLNYPSKVEVIKEGFNSYDDALKQIFISPKNKNFIICNKCLIVGKSDPKSDCFDSIVYLNEGPEKIVIPSFVKHINNFTFSHHSKIKKIEFEENSQINSIGAAVFELTVIENITLPASLKTIKRNAFENCWSLTSIEFLSDEISIDSKCFDGDYILTIVSFPNAVEINVCFDAFKDQLCSVFIQAGGKIIEFSSKYD